MAAMTTATSGFKSVTNHHISNLVSRKQYGFNTISQSFQERNTLYVLLRKKQIGNQNYLEHFNQHFIIVINH